MFSRALHFLGSRSGVSHVIKKPTYVPHRAMAVRARKRFYAEASVVANGNGNFEVCLDHRKLKTPLGNVFKVENEALALAVAQEFMAQKEHIMTSQMHLTGLCNVSLDNPTNVTSEQLVDNVMGFLETDTILFFSDDNEALHERQMSEWLPIITWFRKEICQSESYSDLEPSSGSEMPMPVIHDKCRKAVKDRLKSRNVNSLHGFAFAVDALKSILLTFATMENKLTVEEAVALSRLEVNVQTERWGNVEWAHDLELHDTTARVAAAKLFVTLNSQLNTVKEKNILS